VFPVKEVQAGFYLFGLPDPFLIGVHLQTVEKKIFFDDKAKLFLFTEHRLESRREDNSSSVIYFGCVFSNKLYHPDLFLQL
jgi:hypothetical protein